LGGDGGALLLGVSRNEGVLSLSSCPLLFSSFFWQVIYPTTIPAMNTIKPPTITRITLRVSPDFFESAGGAIYVVSVLLTSSDVDSVSEPLAGSPEAEPPLAAPLFTAPLAVPLAVPSTTLMVLSFRVAGTRLVIL
jgi:hypothetical protein